jgi:hypothetical protein
VQCQMGTNHVKRNELKLEHLGIGNCRNPVKVGNQPARAGGGGGTMRLDIT